MPRSVGIEPTPSCLPGERLDHYLRIYFDVNRLSETGLEVPFNRYLTHTYLIVYVLTKLRKQMFLHKEINLCTLFLFLADRP
jgi:hypothetical protein